MPNTPFESERRLERLLQQTLRELPLRRAPRALELRVLGELQRRASLPWWRRSFAHWPAGARAVFASICVILAGIGFVASSWMLADLESLRTTLELSTPPSARAAQTIMAVMQGLAVALLRAIPADWIHGGLALSAALYAALFGLGIAAYRILYVNSTFPGERT
jgi:hypothetical protein